MQRIGKLALVAAAIVGASPAWAVTQAVTHTISLTGTSANATTGSFTFEGSNYFTGQLILDPFTSFTVAEGDVIEAIVTLTGGFTVPASGEQFFGLNFFQGDFGSPPGYTEDAGPTTEGTLVFSYSLGNTGLPSNTQPGACGNCLSAIGGQFPGNAFTFDGLRVTQTITSLNAPFTIDNASFSYQLRDVQGAVPEPATWAMMLIGFGAVGAALRRRAMPERALA